MLLPAGGEAAPGAATCGGGGEAAACGAGGEAACGARGEAAPGAATCGVSPPSLE